MLAGELASDVAAPPPTGGGRAVKADAALLPTGIYSTGDGQGWQPSATAGLSCLYSASENAVVLSGGVAPGLGRSSDVCVGELIDDDGEGGAPPKLRWEKMTDEHRAFKAAERAQLPA